MGQVQIWTYALSAGDIEITPPTYSFTTISILASGGTVQLYGSKVENGVAAAPIVLLDGQSITINAGNTETNVIDYLYINADVTAYIVGR